MDKLEYYDKIELMFIDRFFEDVILDLSPVSIQWTRREILSGLQGIRDKLEAEELSKKEVTNE